MIKIVLVIGWLICGAMNLCSKNEISKLQYFLVWTVAMNGLIRFLLM